MTEKHNSELHSWLSGEWKRKLNTDSHKPDTGRLKPEKSPDDWIDELELLDAILEE